MSAALLFQERHDALANTSCVSSFSAGQTLHSQQIFQKAIHTSSDRAAIKHAQPSRGVLDDLLADSDGKPSFDDAVDHKNMGACVVNPFSSWMLADLAKP